MMCVPFYDAERRIIGGIGMIRDISQATNAQNALKYQIDFESIVLDISTRFISLDVDHTDENIQRGLERIGRFTQSDRSYLFLYDKEDDTYSNTHEWCAEGIKSQRENLQKLPESMFPVLFGNLQNQECPGK